MGIHDKRKVGITELADMIATQLKQQRRYAAIEFAIVPIPENDRGENFRIKVLNEVEAGTLAVDDARHSVFAPILGQYSLKM